MRKIVLSLLCLVATTLFAGNISIIPQPAQMTVGEGSFTFKKKVSAFVPAYNGDSLAAVFKNFARDFKKATGIAVKTAVSAADAQIVVAVDSTLAPEGYTLQVNRNGIAISASKPAGLFYALQTLKQLMPRNVMAVVPCKEIKEWSAPCVNIKDEPRFGWRGFMLDEGRHFYGKEEIKKIIDMMAAYKMNRFHWHLTEDQGWRIQIKKYPKLTKVGAWRKSKVLGWGGVKPDGILYGGFYTKKDAKEVVQYARERFIEIVPEVDIPGHSQAAVAAYPEFLACDPENSHEVWLWQGVSNDVINVANPKAVQFAKDVIDELTEIFPFGYIHLGGDECPTTKWERNSECQALLKEIGSDKYRDLQIHFYKQLKDYVATKPADKQRKLIFWN